MKRLLINSILLIILIGIPLVPSYLHLYYITVKSNPTISINYDTSDNLDVLKGDITYLKAIFLRATKNNSTNNGEEAPQRTSNTISQLVFTIPSKIEFYTPQIIDRKLLISGKSNLTTIYLKIPSPPPKLFS